MFEANPLPTADSIFQFLAMTTYICPNYDAVLAATVGPHAALDPERSVIGGGLLNEQTERLYHLRGPASLYLLDQINAVTFATELPSAQDEYAELEAAFLADFTVEAELEAFAPTAGYLIATCMRLGSCEGVDVSGNLVSHIEALETGQTVYFFSRTPTVEPQEPTAAADQLASLAAQQAQAAVSSSHTQRTVIGRTTWATVAGLRAASRNPLVSATGLTLLPGEAPSFGCDPAPGAGCMPPARCDQSTGTACELATGCSLITGAGCRSAHETLQALPELDAAGGLIGYRVDTPAAIDPGCSPNTAGHCDGRYDPANWAARDKIEADEVAACWCPANPPPPGYGPPPPGTFMYYRCFCSDAGAMRNRPAE